MAKVSKFSGSVVGGYTKLTKQDKAHLKFVKNQGPALPAGYGQTAKTGVVLSSSATYDQFTSGFNVAQGLTGTPTMTPQPAAGAMPKPPDPWVQGAATAAQVGLPIAGAVLSGMFLGNPMLGMSLGSMAGNAIAGLAGVQGVGGMGGMFGGMPMTSGGMGAALGIAGMPMTPDMRSGMIAGLEAKVMNGTATEADMYMLQKLAAAEKRMWELMSQLLAMENDTKSRIIQNIR